MGFGGFNLMLPSIDVTCKACGHVWADHVGVMGIPINYDCPKCACTFLGSVLSKPDPGLGVFFYDCHEMNCPQKMVYSLPVGFDDCGICGLRHFYYDANPPTPNMTLLWEDSGSGETVIPMGDGEECKCDIMVSRCKCGAFEREKAAKK